LMDVYKIPVLWSLAATVVILITTIVLSLAIPPKAGAKRGAYPFTHKKRQEQRR
jgi:tellurite resistance protein TerC